MVQREYDGSKASPAMQRFFRDALLYVVAFAVVAAVLSVSCWWLLRTTYAGVSDEGAVQVGMASYGAYLRSVARAVVELSAVQVLTIATLTSGLLALPPEAPARRWRL